jgi:hypothetical protein
MIAITITARYGPHGGGIAPDLDEMESRDGTTNSFSVSNGDSTNVTMPNDRDALVEKIVADSNGDGNDAVEMMLVVE